MKKYKLKIIKASDDVYENIEGKFKTENSRKIAKKCLNLCEEWAIMVGESEINNSSIKHSKRSCKAYVKENLKKDVVGGIFLSILLGVVVKLIVDWIVNNFIYSLKK